MGELTITIVGRSGVGKSSLINALLGPTPSRSHKHPVPVSRIPVQFIDTPGLDDLGAVSSRPDPVIEAALDRSDLILFVVDSSASRDYQDRAIAERLHHLGKPVILVINKIDMLPSGVNIEGFSDLGFEKSVRVSVKENLNISTLSKLIADGGTSRVDQEYLLVRAYITGDAPEDKVVAGLVDLYRDLNALHIASGGHGLQVVNWQILTRESTPAEVL